MRVRGTRPSGDRVSPRRGESGQTSVEWLGIAAVALAVILALLSAAPAVGAEVARTVRCVVGAVTAVVADTRQDRCGGGGAPQAPAPTPLETATQGDYIAIGDSFSSGEGAGDYGDSACHRSANAYPVLIGDAYDFGGDVVNATCSGATVDDVDGSAGQHGEPPQIMAITDDASLITIGISGNDTGWSDVVSSCATDGAIGGDLCGDTAAVQAAMDAALADFGALLQEVVAGDHDARVIALGYPRFFPDPPEETWTYGCNPFGCLARISTEEQAWMNELFRDYNDRLEAVAAANGVEFVDVHDAFDGCELTTAGSCMNGLSVDGTLGWPPASADPSSFHPNAQGQQALADLLQDQIEHP
jgi:lysophospholipase L1-like esterase